MASRKTGRRQPQTVAEASGPPFGHTFEDHSLIERALTHRSLAYETSPERLTDPRADNEQLEFVGDAVLGLIVAEALYRRFPQAREGELTRLRASIVSRKNLGKVATRIDLGRHLHLGKGEERSGGRGKSAILSNAIEAVIAAIYLDGGLGAATTFVEKNVIEPALPEMTIALADPNGSSGAFSGAVGDHKSALQEHLQAGGLGQPEYLLTGETGPAHQKQFHIQVRVGEAVLADAAGPTKKAAQQEAARLAFQRLLAQEAALPANTPQADSAVASS